MKLGRMQMAIPDDWEDRSLYTYVAPPESVSMGMTAQEPRTFRTNVVVTRKPMAPGWSLDASVRAIEARTKRDFGQIEIKVDDAGSVASQPAKRLRYIVNDPGQKSLPVAQVLYVFLLEGAEWTVTFSVASMALKEQLPEFERMVRSIVWT